MAGLYIHVGIAATGGGRLLLLLILMFLNMIWVFKEKAFRGGGRLFQFLFIYCLLNKTFPFLNIIIQIIIGKIIVQKLLHSVTVFFKYMKTFYKTIKA